MIESEHSHWNEFFRYNPASRHRRRMIRGLIAGLPVRSVLDAGCGSGELLYDLFHPNRGELRLKGFDKNRAETPTLLRKLGAAYETLDIDAAALPETYDLVIASEMVEHTRDDAVAMRHLARMTSRWILVTVPSGRIYPSDKAMGHVRHYTPQSLRSLAESAGFRTLRCFAWGWPFHSLYRHGLNMATDDVLRGFGQEKYTSAQILLCEFLYLLFFLNSGRHGQQLFYLGERPLA
jgi:SAM-dependent methyltransferase